MCEKILKGPGDLKRNQIILNRTLDQLSNISPPALVAQFAVHQTGEQEVAGSNPARLATFFRED